MNNITKVKICGITNFEDALLATELGADMLGFNFYEKSPRYVEPDLALDIVTALPKNIIKVGVFVNMESRRIDELVRSICLDAVQVHGDEDAAYLKDLRNKTSAKIIKTCRIRPDETNGVIADGTFDYLLFDSFSEEYGGSGKTFDWSVANGLDELRKTMILAGGLTPDSVAGAIDAVRPYAVDVASGVESGPRKKDARKLEAFIRNAKNA